MIKDIEESKIEVYLNTEASLELISNMKPDALMIATGSSPFILPIQGANKCIIAHDVLSEKVNVKGENVVIIGGGLVGFETAEFLASQGKKITILEMKEKALQDLGPLRQITAQFAMNKLPITIETNATVEKIEYNVVIASGKEYFYDDVIMAVGSKANDTNIYENLDIPTYVIGDCKKAGVALDAFKDAYYAVLDINKK